MDKILFQTLIPFTISALVVIVISFIAERYGTKVGGIIGTLPSTIVVAFIFIALNRDIDFATRSVAVVPAEMGINILFLFTFAMLSSKATSVAIASALSVWAALTMVLYAIDVSNIYYSLVVYALCLFVAFMVLERVKKVPSKGKVKVQYTVEKIVFRGVIAGVIIALAVFLSNVGEVISGIFSVFPAIFLSTLLIMSRDHGSEFAGGIAKSMIIGTPTVTSYAVSIHFLYPEFGLVWGSAVAYCVSILFVLTILKVRGRIR